MKKNKKKKKSEEEKKEDLNYGHLLSVMYHRYFIYEVRFKDPEKE